MSDDVVDRVAEVLNRVNNGGNSPQLAAAQISAQWRAVKRAYGIIGKAALDAFTSMKRSFDDPQYTKGA